MINIDNKYNIGETVYLKTDNEQLQRIVTAIKVLPNDIIYYLSCGTQETAHYDFEITKEKSYCEKE